ncbi:MAG: AAA family ATPase, partial [Deltaproteobacteria bacterium]|nr:AAA family ATPase [Deltaproteobacteria bacterium]
MTMNEILLTDRPFREIRDKNIFYVDKTRYIHQLLTRVDNSFFLSRPRRFGKTLLLYTLEEIFSGNRERFKGLWIERSDYAFPRRPVLFLSLAVDSENPEILEKAIANKLDGLTQAANLRQTVKWDTLSDYF